MQAVTGPGGVVAGRYELLDRIGQGAMGTVWQARDLVLTREVAIKEVRLPGLMPDEDRKVLRERTLREARVSAKLSHPGVVTVYDVIEAGGTPWIVMELVAARSLEQVLAQNGPLPPRQAASIGVMLLGALATAHAAGIVHRDVKPGNVLITGDGRALLTDFGIATLDGDPRLTQAGMVMGTPGFCAPERIRGEPASPASDLWSLGATLYAAVEGRGPFEGHGSPMAVLASIVHSDPPRVQAHGQLGMVIHSLMSKDPGQRPDAACAIRLLADVAAGNSETVLAASPDPGGTRPGTGGTRPATTLVSAMDRTSPTGFPARTPGNGPPASPGYGSQPSRPAPARDRAAPAGTAHGGTAHGGTAGSTAHGSTAQCGTADGTAQFPAGTGPGGVPVPAGMAEVPFPDGVGDVMFPVSPGATVPPWAASGRPVPRAARGSSGAPGRLGSATGGSPAGGPGGGPGHPAAQAVAGRKQAGHGVASQPLGGAVPIGPGLPPPWAPAPPGPPGPSGQLGPRGQRGTLPQPPRRSTASRVLILSLAGAAIVLAGLTAGVLFARSSGTAQPSTGTGGASPAAALPAGYRWYSQPTAAGTAAGFAMAVPDGWQGSRQGAATDLRDSMTGGTITASFTPFTVSGPVREAQALELAAVSRGTYPGYRRITITPWLLHGQLAGAWRFSYRQRGTGLIEGLEVVSDLPTAGGPQPYELLVTAPLAHWQVSKAAFAEALHTLRAGP